MGILIGSLEVQCMQKAGVKNVEMSLLGATAATYDAIVGFPGAPRKLKEAMAL